LVVWSVGWLVVWSVGWLVVWSVGWLVVWLFGSDVHGAQTVNPDHSDDLQTFRPLCLELISKC